jgi:hypothetical protein
VKHGQRCQNSCTKTQVEQYQARLEVFVALDDTETIVMAKTSAVDSWEEDKMEGVSK